ncbi:MAG TPA: zeta toxin family protein [Flavipsychrobacter sp.]|nr:zeta toxin family protein [Flavipsychrobacter sp.]
MPHIYIIAGCNGAGKTTASLTVLPEILDCKEFVNADMIAYGLSPLNQTSVAVQAGRMMLARIRELMLEKKDFAFETTLATRSYVKLVQQAKESGYHVTLLYFWLHSPEQAKARVADRVAKGGHHIPEETIERRYYRGIRNFFEMYIPIVTKWNLLNNTTGSADLVAEGGEDFKTSVILPEVWKNIKTQSR